MATLDYTTEVETLAGEKKTLEEYRGQVLLIVNTASKCGFTPQYAGLQKLHEELQGQGLRILGFPCNQFGKQEPGDADQIGSFCQRNYGVDFDMFAKIAVNGANTHPLYQQLKSAAPGFLGTQAIKWNFTKFVVNRDGEIVGRLGSRDTPEKVRPQLTELL